MKIRVEGDNGNIKEFEGDSVCILVSKDKQYEHKIEVQGFASRGTSLRAAASLINACMDTAKTIGESIARDPEISMLQKIIFLDMLQNSRSEGYSVQLPESMMF